MTNREAKIIIDKLARTYCADEVVFRALLKASTALEILGEQEEGAE